ncbi:MAG: nitroreductase family protein, partial [Clostridia bacterium]|nr:nitroreductase family protein [Clostridia bacterium]
DKTLGTNKFTDVGITSQTIMLGATEIGLGGCMLGNIKRSEIAENFGIDRERFTVELVLALGKPKEEVKIVSLPENGDVRYYRDENMTHYVPKRSLEDIVM